MPGDHFFRDEILPTAPTRTVSARDLRPGDELVPMVTPYRTVVSAQVSDQGDSVHVICDNFEFKTAVDANLKITDSNAVIPEGRGVFAEDIVPADVLHTGEVWRKVEGVHRIGLHVTLFLAKGERILCEPKTVLVLVRGEVQAPEPQVDDGKPIDDVYPSVEAAKAAREIIGEYIPGVPYTQYTQADVDRATAACERMAAATRAGAPLREVYAAALNVPNRHYSVFGTKACPACYAMSAEQQGCNHPECPGTPKEQKADAWAPPAPLNAVEHEATTIERRRCATIVAELRAKIAAAVDEALQQIEGR